MSIVELGKQIRIMRLKKDMSRKQFAKLAGISFAYAGAIERGERNLTVMTLCRVAKALDQTTIAIEVI